MSDTITHDLNFHLAEAHALFPGQPAELVREYAENRMHHEHTLAKAPALTACPAWCTSSDTHDHWELEVPSFIDDKWEYVRYHRTDFGDGVGIYQAEFCAVSGERVYEAPNLSVDEAEDIDSAKARRISSALLRAAHKLDQITRSQS